MSDDAENRLGKEVLSFCGKCKMALGHLIVSVDKKGSADKCQCMTCKAVHKYRDPDKPAKAPGSGKRAAQKESVSTETLWNQACTKAKGPSKPYAMTAEFSLGDLIEHPLFGRGVVQELIGQNKIRAIFERSEKVLIHKLPVPE